ncbi:hypothetical protein [Paenibacillus sp.]|uniref:hypothetical protein n=1 Tax=Paenibacillus sp. TaxID=58172 RepID=UPI00281161E2|nr:hypothetical protein [Paenibacillus sp.]
MFIPSPLSLDFKVTRIMRYLTQAKQSGAQPVVILTKAELVDRRARNKTIAMWSKQTKKHGGWK